MRFALFIFNLVICSIFFSIPLQAQRTFYTTGMGGDDINWLTAANWSEDSSGFPLSNTPPSPNDHVVIRHDIFQKVEAGYIHYGNITITREGFFSIFSGFGLSDPYIFAGDLCLVQGHLMTSSDFHHQIFQSEGDGLLVFDTYAVAEIGDDLILNGHGHTLMNNADCGAGGSFDDLYFKGEHATLCGNGRFVVPDAIRAWDDDNREIFPSTLQTVNQICEGFLFYGTLQDCINDEQPTFPIELLSFEAELHETEVLLSWATVWERNNNFFTLERSTDGDEYQPIADIPGAVNSDQLETYEYIDYQPLSGKSYYRLKQTDLDGRFSYSQVVAINFQPVQSYMRMYPNPRRYQETVSIDNWGLTPNSQAIIHIMNISGQIVIADRINIDDRGFGRYEMTQALPSGVYFVRTRTHKGWMMEKLVVS